MLSDLEIAQAATLRPIAEIAAELGLNEDEIEPYGRYKAKVQLSAIERLRDRPNAKYILVTAITPTPAAGHHRAMSPPKPATAEATQLSGSTSPVAIHTPQRATPRRGRAAGVAVRPTERGCTGVGVLRWLWAGRWIDPR